MDNITQRLNERLSERPDPSEAQKSAGNYKKGMVFINGMRVSIENPAGSTRKGKDQDGNEWESELKHHYGYIRGTQGRDKDHVDAFLASGGSVGGSDRVHIIDQVDPKTGRFDEHKVILGAKDKDHAADTYLANYPEDWDGFGAVTEMPLKAFKQWAFQPGRRVKALSSEVHDNHMKAKTVQKFAEGGSVLGALKDNQFWRDVMGNAGDMAQSASNAVAGNVAGPVDMVNWGLKKAGIGSEKPVLGSDWLKDRGLMRDVAQNPASLAGETLGLLAPAALIGGAPKIAGALNKGAENLAKPRMMRDETGAINIDALLGKHPDLDVSLFQNGDKATLSKLVVPKEMRNQGQGSRFMSDLVKAADDDGAKVVLSPSSDFGGSKSRLVDFYKEFGFVPNKGRNKDFAISESMYRDPVQQAAADYRGLHTAPMKGEGSAPLHELNQIYPDDIYSGKAAQYYGHYGDSRDGEAVRLMQAAKGKPNMPVTMYRAVPHEPSAAEQLALLEKQMAAYMKRGVNPDGSKGSGWYNSVYDKREQLRKAAEAPEVAQKLSINNGDWVTLSKAYAKEHGEGALNGDYKIISQKVPARKLFTDGNSIHEFGYDMSGKALPEMLGMLGLGAAGVAYLGGGSDNKPMPETSDQLPGFATGGSVPSGPAYGDRENGYFNADGSQYKPVTTRAATDADKSAWTLNAADVDKLLTDDAMGGGRSWTYQDGQPHADLTLSGGKKWNPSGAASGIRFHKKGDPIYDQSQQPSADAGGPVISGQYEQDTYDISGDLSAMTGKPGSNLHTNIQYQKVGDKLVPINTPDYWDWAVNNRATNGEFIQALSMMAPAVGGIMTNAGVGALTSGQSASLQAGKGALMNPTDPLKGAATGALGSYMPSIGGEFLSGMPDAVKGAITGGLSSALTGGNPLVGAVGGATGAAIKDATGSNFLSSVGKSIAAGMASGKTPDQVITGLLQNPGAFIKALSNGQTKSTSPA